jgi:hypothetical protein
MKAVELPIQPYTANVADKVPVLEKENKTHRSDSENKARKRRKTTAAVDAKRP